MKKILIFIGLLSFVIMLWYFSFILPLGVVSNNELNLIFGSVNNWFSMVSLVAALFALCIVVLKIEFQQKQFDTLMKQYNANLEIIALSSLIQESDATLHRYDRWEAAGIKGDYVNAKSDVREKMNGHRELLDEKYRALRGQ